MLVRESPKAKVSPDKNEANWPPKSPFEALTSSPSGRRRLQSIQDGMTDRSPSPSPLRRPMSSSKALQAMTGMSHAEMGDGLGAGHSEDEDEDDDEETLQLQLQAIQAKLKLKKLQSKKRQATTTTHGQSPAAEEEEHQQLQDHDGEQFAHASSPPRKRQKLSSLLPGVQIPLSPIKDRLPPPEPQKPTSPARVLLGIDKGLKAKDVSLKRARNPALHNRPGAAAATPDPQQATPKMSFSERIAASRLSNEEKLAKQDRIAKSRSAGFGLTTTTSVPSSAASTPMAPADTTPSLPPPPSSHTPAATPRFRRPPPLPSDATSPFNATRHTEPPQTAQPPTTASAAAARPQPPPRASTKRRAKDSPDLDSQSTEPQADGTSFEAFSSLHLSKRRVPHTDLAREFAGKEIYTIPRLFKEVTAPVYQPPDCETDFIVLAVLAAKSSPYETKNRSQQAETDDDDAARPRNKFMVLTLTDLKWELDLFLFDTAFDQFWKLTPGTVLAILNPAIMPPKGNRHNGRFSLKFSSSDDAVLEIGTARDLAFCKSVKKDGKQCASWVNARKSEFCDYHVELAVAKAKRGRMETATMFSGAPPQDPDPRGKSRRGYLPPPLPPHLRNAHKDYESGANFYLGSNNGLSAARLFDSDDIGRAEAMRKRLAESEKERELARRLGELGNGMGAEYLAVSSAANAATTTRAARSLSSSKPTSSTAAAAGSAHARQHEHNTAAATATADAGPPPSAADLGLVNSRANVRLSPGKGRKRAFASAAASASAAAGSDAFGWGANNRRGILLPPAPAGGRVGSPERERGKTRLQFSGTADGLGAGAGAGAGVDAGVGAGVGDVGTREREPSPAKKRARFVTAKGIREPGRDSLGELREKMRAKGRVIVGGDGGGGAWANGEGDEDDDDDDLLIV